MDSMILKVFSNLNDSTILGLSLHPTKTYLNAPFLFSFQACAPTPPQRGEVCPNPDTPVDKMLS